MGDQLGPTLVQVAGATRISGQQSIAEIGMPVMVLLIEIMTVPRKHDLVGLLEILAGRKIIGNLGRKGIVSDLLQVVHEFQVA